MNNNLKDHAGHPAIWHRGSLNVPARASLVYTASNIFSRLCALVFTPIFTRVLSVTEYGELSLFGTYLSVLSAICTLEIGGGVLLRAYGKYKDESERLLLLSFSMTVAVSGAVFPLFYLLGGGDRLFGGAMPMLYISVISGSFINLFCARCKYFYKTRPFILLTLASSLISSLIALCFVSLPELSEFNKAAIRAGVSTAVVALSALFALIYTLRTGRGRGRGRSSAKAMLGYVLRLALPMLPYYASVMLISQTDKLMIQKHLGADELARYSIAYSLALAISVFSSGLSQVLGTWLIRRGNDGKRVARVADISAFLLSLVAIGYLSVAPELLAIVAPVSYASALPCIYPLTLSVIPVFLSGICTSVSLLEERCAAASVSGIIAALFHSALSKLLIPRYGIVAAAAVHLCSYIILCISFVCALRIKKGQPPIRALPHLAIFSACALLALAEYRLRASLFPRLVIALLCGAVALSVVIKNRALIFEKRTS